MRRGRAAPAVAVLGLGKAGGALLASLRAARVPVVAHARRVAALRRARGLDNAELLFLAVPDDAITAVAAELATFGALPSAVAHLSGSRGLDALSALRDRTAVASFHPLASLDGTHAIPHGTLIAWDTRDRRVGASLASLARLIGGVPAHVRDEARVLYHAGAVVAGNLPVALLHEGIGLLVDAGVPERTARMALARLLRSQADNAERHPLPLALSGPVARGDAETLTRHLLDLDRRAPPLATTYRELSRILIDEVATHPPATRTRLRRALAHKRQR